MAMGRFRETGAWSLKAKEKLAKDWTPMKPPVFVTCCARPTSASSTVGTLHERLYAPRHAGLNSLFIRGDGGYAGWRIYHETALDCVLGCIFQLAFSRKLFRNPDGSHREFVNSSDEDVFPDISDTSLGEGQATSAAPVQAGIFYQSIAR